ncbi:replication protein A 32 kDa subunit-like [Ornithodoros turicata]
MWNDSNFGGGFVTSPAKAGGSDETPQRRQQGGRQNVVPCTIAQILQSGDEMMLGSVEVQYVKVIGMIVSVNQQSTRVSFTLDDRTGSTIEGQIFSTESDEQTKLMSQLIEKTYVRVVGSVRNIEGRKILKVFKVNALYDLNELSMHMAEVVYSHLAVEAMEKKKGDPMETSNFVGDVGTAMGLTREQKMVFEVVRNCMDEGGLTVQDICTVLPSVKMSSITDIIEFLTNEGHIYTTFDDSHYKATDSG